MVQCIPTHLQSNVPLESLKWESKRVETAKVYIFSLRFVLSSVGGPGPSVDEAISTSGTPTNDQDNPRNNSTTVETQSDNVTAS